MAQLTTEQQAVVNHSHGHARVVAVAGAGKTTTLTHFIRARLQAGVSPRRILVLMYNKAAQLDFKARLERLLPNQPLPEIRTFHSLGLRIYQRLVARGVLPAWDGRLLGDGESEGVVWRLLQQLAASDDIRQEILSQRKKWVEPALGFIDRVKSGLDSPAQVFEQQKLPEDCALFVPLFDAFEAWRKEQRRISFADMLYDPVCCFRQNPQLAAEFGGHMAWTLVDEYQDINAIQQYLLETLQGGRGHVMVIGDPDQTIYEFRGSRPEFIIRAFEQQFENVSRYPLPHTFRYGHHLALLANHLIQHNRDRDPLLCLSHDSTPDTAVQVHRCSSEDEAGKVLSLVQAALLQRPAEQIAVIHRLWALCAPIELAFLQAGIPYQLHHSQSVLERWELQIFWLLLEIAAGEFHQRNRDQRYAGWQMLLTTPFPKIKRPILDGLAQRLANVGENLGVALQQALPDDMNKWQKRQLLARAELLDSAEHQPMPAGKLLADYLDATDLESGLADSAFSAQQIEDRQQTLRAFVRFMQQSGLMSDQALYWLRDLKARRMSQVQLLADGRQNGEPGEGVHLTSIHKSKGLEWPVVIIPGVNNHYFPYEVDGEFTTPASEESERRLLYVAMTRASLELHLLIPAASGSRSDNPRDVISRFYPELAVENSRRLGQALKAVSSPSALSSSSASSSASSLAAAGQTPLRLQAPVASWLGDYLQAVGKPLAIGVEEEMPSRRSAVSSRAESPLSGRRADKDTSARNTRSRDTSSKDARTRDIRIRRRAQVRSGTGVGGSKILSIRVWHPTLGRGRLQELDPRYYRIRFDSDDAVRTLDRSVADALLEWPDGPPQG